MAEVSGHRGIVLGFQDSWYESSGNPQLHSTAEDPVLLRKDTRCIRCPISCFESFLVLRVVLRRTLYLNPWPESGRRSDGVNFLQCPKTQTKPGATWASKKSLSAMHAVFWQLNRTLKSKQVDYRKNWGAADSWLSFAPSFTVNSVSLSGCKRMPGKIVSTSLHQLH